MRALAWFGLLAPPLAWTVLLVSGYAVEEAACSTGPNREPVLDMSAVGPVVGGVAIAALAIGGAALVAALASWLPFRRNGPSDRRGRLEFTAGAAVVSAVTFLTVIVLTAIASVSFDACQPG